MLPLWLQTVSHVTCLIADSVEEWVEFDLFAAGGIEERAHGSLIDGSGRGRHEYVRLPVPVNVKHSFPALRCWKEYTATIPLALSQFMIFKIKTMDIFKRKEAC